MVLPCDLEHRGAPITALTHNALRATGLKVQELLELIVFRPCALLEDASDLFLL